MRHPDVFGAVYATSGSFFHVSQQDYHVNLSDDMAVFSDIILDFANVTDPAAQLAGVQSPADFANSNFEKLIYSLAAFHSPNLNNPELFVDLPFELPSLQVVPTVRDRWLENDQFRLLEEYAPNLSSLRGLAFDVGDRDQIGARQHSELITLSEASQPPKGATGCSHGRQPVDSNPQQPTAPKGRQDGVSCDMASHAPFASSSFVRLSFGVAVHMTVVGSIAVRFTERRP